MAIVKNALMILFFLLMLFSFFFDREVLNFAGDVKNGNLNFIAVVLSHVAFLIVALFVCSYILKDKKKIVYLWGGVAFSYVVSVILKALVQRVRPIESGLSSFSFPSSHATVYFFIFALMFGYSKKYGSLFFVLAVLVALSRVYLGQHYLSDVIGGGLLGVSLYLLLRRWIKT